MRLIPLAVAPPARTPARQRWSVATSVLLHLLGLVAVIGIATRNPPSGEGAAPAYDLVFEGRQDVVDQQRPPGLPPIQPADIPVAPDAPAGQPAPDPLTPPQPDAATASPSPTQPTTANAPTPEAPPTPEVAQSAPSQLAFAPEAQPSPAPTPAPAPARMDTSSPPKPPTVNLQLPPEPTTAPALDPIMPQPPPPLPEAPPRPAPRQAQVRPAPRAQQGTLANPMDLSFAPSAPRPAARGRYASGAIDLSPPPERRGGARSDPYALIRAANASADWNRGLLQYWLQHRFYPSKAAEAGEQGTVTIQLTVNRSGRVEDVQVLTRSGSQWLDMAAVGTFRDAKLPPFTSEMREDRLTFPIPINYYLVRQ